MADLLGGSRAGRAVVLTLGALLAFTLGGCAPAAPSADPIPARNDGVLSELVGIEDGRAVHLECRGSGSPTVVFVSGTRGAADEWQTLLPDVAEGVASTFDAVAAETRACAYDRPGTLRDDGSPTDSTAVAQPTTAREGADDLHAVLRAAGEDGPYVVVGLSLGGMIAQQFARAYAADVHGLVLLDSASEYLQSTFTPAQWNAWMKAIAASGDGVAETPDYEASIDELRATPALARTPVVVISSDQPWDLQVTPGASTWQGWLEAQELLADALDAEHISDTSSGHGLPAEQPELVTNAILDVVGTTRRTG